LDEQTFEKLLEAAYVLQEHNRKMQEVEQRLESHSERRREQELAARPLASGSPVAEETSRAESDYTLTLSQIVEAQHQIQMHHLGLDAAMAVVAERVARITHSSGAAIALLDGKIVRYRAGTGAPALPIGSETPLDTAVCLASIRTGKVIRSEDVNTEFLFDPELCRQRGILSLLSVPIYHDGDIVGALELYFDRIGGFAEQDIHTCQLMAGLVTEAIGRDADLKLQNSMAAERTTMLAAMEKLKPLTRNEAPVAEQEPVGAAGVRVQAISELEFPCWKCGGSLLAEEQFCGKCGAPRASGGEPSSMQSKVASAWHRQQNKEGLAATLSNADVAGRNGMHRAADQMEKEDPGYQGKETELPEDSLSEGSPTSLAEGVDDDAMAVSSNHRSSQRVSQDHSTALVVPQQEDVVWSSAAKARDFLESLSGKPEEGALARYWRSRRGDFYLGLALVFVVVVIRWGIWSDSSAGAAGTGTAIAGTHHKRFDPNANLSTFDKFLIGMGLAEAPDPPEYKGNPNAQVWVDLHTALYYCPGSDLYGKTPKGKTTSQRDAQLDQFEPASRKACD
ncbi:MAG TPA: GAF domain-containing protein, partial [Candidatus Sulfotelmatobacter sp.]|nr:GAF domain-containing protein [Candidatus Sulfotelmatobacter sp.]